MKRFISRLLPFNINEKQVVFHNSKLKTQHSKLAVEGRVSIFFMLFLSILLAACTEKNISDQIVMEETQFDYEEEPAYAGNSEYAIAEQPFAGKIAIITAPSYQHTETYTSARQVVEKYGKDKVIHRTWPDKYRDETEQVISVVEKLGNDPNIKAIITSDVVPGMNAGFDTLRETRPDIFLACYQLTSEYNIAQIANLILGEDMLGTGPAMVEQAQKMGAKTFVFYSIERLNYPVVFEIRKLIIKRCKELNLEFVEAIDLNEPSSIIHFDIGKYVQIYGKDTAFYCPVAMNDINEEVIKEGAILPQPLYPSPYWGFPSSLGIGFPDGKNFNEVDELLPLDYLISEAKRITTEKGISGRLSAWPMPGNMLNTVASAEYAIKWINGEVPKKGVDVEVLRQIMEDYVGVKVYLTPYTDKYPYTADVDTEVMEQIQARIFRGETYFPYTDEYPYPYTEKGDGETYDNFLLMRMDYITF